MKFKQFAFISLGIVSSTLAAKEIRFNKDVLPILSDKCYFCHGPDAHDIKGKLQLHTFENATHERVSYTSSGKERRRDPAIIPRNLEDSLVWERITTDDEDDIMPPLESHKPLTKKEIKTIKQWIEQGANYEPHWSYTPIKSTAKDIDSLVKTKYKEHKLDFNKEASKRTLIRRLSFDLRGLPPSPEEISAFLKDDSDQAWEKLIDQFLASSAYGEKMGLYWLDLVRYADTVGYHGDQNQDVQAYRDYVIQAFNDNKKFDDFTREQLAGDLFENPSRDNLIASCYNRLNMVSREGGAQAKEYLAKYAQDRVATTSAAWLGSTLACAECHDHKYDPFTAKDFYSFAAFFADIQEVGVYNKNPVTGGRLDNSKPFPPIMLLNEEEVKAQEKSFKKEVAALEKTKTQLFQAAEYGEPQATELQSYVEPLAVKGNTDPKQNIQFKLKDPVKQIILEFPNDQKQSLAMKYASFEINGKKQKPKYFHASKSDNNNKVGNLFKNNKRVWKFTSDKTEALVITFANKISGDVKVELTFNSAPKQAFSLSVSQDKFFEGNDITKLRANNRNAHKDLYLRLNHKEYKNTITKIAQLNTKKKNAEDLFGKHVQITVPVEPRVMRILPRGNWQDDSGEIVQPAVPSFLGQIDKEGRASRLDLANWIVSKENPLTARTFTNRIWKQFFGRGLAADVTDLGAQGQAPENPALLDYLASSFMQDWDVKKLVKGIVSSKAYRQSSEANDKLKTYDPFNDYLARQQAERIDAEYIRDNALEISGLLKHKFGGDVSKPYQPEGYYKDLNFPIRTYQHDKGDQQYRRGVYVHRQRTYLHPMLKAFDTPSREQCVAERSVSNTPLQALNLLNDPTFIEAAKSFAEKTIKAKADTTARLQLMFEKCTGRPADAQELTELTKFIEQELAFYSNKEAKAKEILSIGLKKADPKLDTKELAAWTSLARVLLNLHETITVY